MVKIRLSRTGRKGLPTYRIVVIPQEKSTVTKFIEDIGYYHPITKAVSIDKERAEYWLSVGAQPSDTVKRLMVKQKLMAAPKYKKKFNSKPGKKATERAEKAE